MKRALIIGWLVLAGCGGKKPQSDYVTSPVTRGNIVARVTASEYGKTAAGYDEACALVGA